MASYNVWYASPNHLGYCSKLGFIGSLQSDALHLANDVVKPGDVYIYKDRVQNEQQFVHKLVDEKPNSPLPFIENCDNKDTAYINYIEWSKDVTPLSWMVAHGMATPRCEDYLDEIVNSQTPLLHRRVPFLPQKGTWCYVANASTNFNYKHVLALRWLLLEKDYKGNVKDEKLLNPKLMASLTNPRIKTLVFVISGRTLETGQMGKIWGAVKEILIHYWGYDHDVVVWDAGIFANVVSHFMRITNEIVRKWYWDLGRFDREMIQKKCYLPT